MLDAILRDRIDPPLDWAGRRLAALGIEIRANAVAGAALLLSFYVNAATFMGFAVLA